MARLWSFVKPAGGQEYLRGKSTLPSDYKLQISGEPCTVPCVYSSCFYCYKFINYNTPSLGGNQMHSYTRTTVQKYTSKQTVTSSLYNPHSLVTTIITALYNVQFFFFTIIKTIILIILFPRLLCIVLPSFKLLFEWLLLYTVMFSFIQCHLD